MKFDPTLLILSIFFFSQLATISTGFHCIVTLHILPYARTKQKCQIVPKVDLWTVICSSSIAVFDYSVKLPPFTTSLLFDLYPILSVWWLPGMAAHSWVGGNCHDLHIHVVNQLVTKITNITQTCAQTRFKAHIPCHGIILSCSFNSFFGISFTIFLVLHFLIFFRFLLLPKTSNENKAFTNITNYKNTK